MLPAPFYCGRFPLPLTISWYALCLMTGAPPLLPNRRHGCAWHLGITPLRKWWPAGWWAARVPLRGTLGASGACCRMLRTTIRCRCAAARGAVLGGEVCVGVNRLCIWREVESVWRGFKRHHPCAGSGVGSNRLHPCAGSGVGYNDSTPARAVVWVTTNSTAGLPRGGSGVRRGGVDASFLTSAAQSSTPAPHVPADSAVCCNCRGRRVLRLPKRAALGARGQAASGAEQRRQHGLVLSATSGGAHSSANGSTGD